MSDWVRQAKSFDLEGYGTVAVTLLKTIKDQELFQVTVALSQGRMGWIVADELSLVAAEEVFLATNEAACKEYCDSSPWAGV